MTDAELIEEREREIQRLQHAMQAGVAAEMNIKTRAAATEPKQLRVGVNTALVDHCALVKLLVKKGVITMAEYQEARLQMWRFEVKTYEKRLSDHFGKPVRLA